MDSPEPGLMLFGERVQEALVAETQPALQLQAARADLLEQVTSVPPPSWRGALGGFRLAAGVIVIMLGLAVAFNQWFLRPISFVTGSAPRGVGDALEADRHEPLRVEFSEGSLLLLREGSRARVLDTQAVGARVLLERGVADVSIAHRVGRATRWRFEAGPFQVLVKGTQFELDWQPEAQALSLTMKSGRVELSGACLPKPRVVERGASLRLSCAKTSAPLAAALPLPAPAISALLPPSAAANSKLQHTGHGEPKSLVRSFEDTCEKAAKPELVAWANQDRLAGRLDRARTALLVLRRRFVGSTEAATAAFTLGRMEFDQRANYKEAARWFAAYLTERPSGPLMGDAAGRLLEAHEQAGDRAAARRDAQAYLRRFPDGPYASRARRILAE